MSEPIDPVATLADDEPPTVVICEADGAHLDLPDEDPFDATLQLTGTDQSGTTDVIAWLRLTPTTINHLVAQLEHVLHEQQHSLGIWTGPTGVDPTHADTENDPHTFEPDPDAPADGRVRQFLDPLGLRHLRNRSPRTTVVMGAAIAALLLLTVVVQLVRG